MCLRVCVCVYYTVAVLPQEDPCALVVETSGVDGEPGEEEVVGENVETSAAYVCKVCTSPSSSC